VHKLAIMSIRSQLDKWKSPENLNTLSLTLINSYKQLVCLNNSHQKYHYNTINSTFDRVNSIVGCQCSLSLAIPNPNAYLWHYKSHYNAHIWDIIRVFIMPLQKSVVNQLNPQQCIVCQLWVIISTWLVEIKSREWLYAFNSVNVPLSWPWSPPQALVSC